MQQHFVSSPISFHASVWVLRASVFFAKSHTTAWSNQLRFDALDSKALLENTMGHSGSVVTQCSQPCGICLSSTRIRSAQHYSATERVLTLVTSSPSRTTGIYLSDYATRVILSTATFKAPLQAKTNLHSGQCRYFRDPIRLYRL